MNEVNLSVLLCILLVCMMATIGEKQDKSEKRTVCFLSHVNERGVDVAVFDYADYNEKILGQKSVILIPDTPQCRNGASLGKYVERFDSAIVFYTKQFGRQSLPVEAKRAGCDLIYIQKSGDKLSHPRYPDYFNHSLVPACVHAVFVHARHGPEVPYAAISPSVLGIKANSSVVPLIVRPPSPHYNTDKVIDLRKELKIPLESFVFCRHGGIDTFNVKFVLRSVHEMINKYQNVTFLFLGTGRFDRHGFFLPKNSKVKPHPRIIHLSTNSKIEYKERFIKSCDAMLHGRIDGETFGLAIAEFSVRNKPVITFPGEAKEHIRILGDKAFVYKNQKELNLVLSHFIEYGVNKSIDYNAYREYSPEIVMKQFKNIFLDPVFGK